MAKALRGIDGGLHLFLGDIDIQTEVELQDNDRASGADGSHLVQAWQLAKWRSSGAVTVVATTSGSLRDKR